MHQDVIRYMIKQTPHQIADNVLVKGRAGTARIVGVDRTVGERIQINICVFRQKSVRAAPQVVITDIERVRSHEIGIQHPARNWTRVLEGETRSPVGDLPWPRIEAAVKSE